LTTALRVACDVAIRRRIEERLEDDDLVPPLDTHRRTVDTAVFGDGGDDALDDHGFGGGRMAATACLQTVSTGETAPVP
jgi:hypothetical protein